jgi:hypothetical protein
LIEALLELIEALRELVADMGYAFCPHTIARNVRYCGAVELGGTANSDDRLKPVTTNEDGRTKTEASSQRVSPYSLSGSHSVTS